MVIKIADALAVSIDYLIGATLALDKITLRPIQEIQGLTDQDKTHPYAPMDAFLRDAKTKRTYAD